MNGRTNRSMMKMISRQIIVVSLIFNFLAGLSAAFTHRSLHQPQFYPNVKATEELSRRGTVHRLFLNDRLKRSELGSTMAGPPPPDMSSFGDRMRSLVNTQQERKASRAIRQSKKPKNLLTVTTLDDYDKALKAAGDKLVVVRFYAEWCKVRHITIFSFQYFLFIRGTYPFVFFGNTST